MACLREMMLVVYLDEHHVGCEEPSELVFSLLTNSGCGERVEWCGLAYLICLHADARLEGSCFLFTVLRLLALKRRIFHPRIAPLMRRGVVWSASKALQCRFRNPHFRLAPNLATSRPQHPSSRLAALRLGDPIKATVTTMAEPQDKVVSLVNRCNESKSPYVRSHMENPTAWQLWTPETLELAKRTNRLLFVSIGYSACHWCHVMAHESFDDTRIAQLLNEHFVPIKIDRY